MHDFLKASKHLLRRYLLESRLMLQRSCHIDDHSSILVIAPHPDDEIIGIGGYLIDRIRSGKRVAIVYLTDGEKSLEELEPSVVALERHNLTCNVLSRLGLPEEHVRWLHLPDGSIPRLGSDRFEHAKSQIEAIISDISPDAIFVTHPLDTWPYDHVAAFELTEKAVHAAGVRCSIYGYWVWLWYSVSWKNLSGIRWGQICRIPVNGSIQEKINLMDLYLKPTAPDGRPWSGVLPAAMLRVFHRPYEVVEKFMTN